MARKGHTYPALQLAVIIRRRKEVKFLGHGRSHWRWARRNSEMVQNLACDLWRVDD